MEPMESPRPDQGTSGNTGVLKIPRAKDDYTHEMARQRRDFIGAATGAPTHHLGIYSIKPDMLPGNIEHFSGVAQVPIGFAGPLLVDGEHAKGRFYVPLATTEGTLVGSYNRGMKLIAACGGVRTTVMDDAMNRAPVFGLRDAREVREFGRFIEEHTEDLRRVAEATTSVGTLKSLQQFTASRMMFLRVNMHTGDAAGQNMVSRATGAICEWIHEHWKSGFTFFNLTGNFCTDKKYSVLNTLHTRGRKVVAEVTIPADRIEEILGVSGERLFRHRVASGLGSQMSGTNNTGLHSANALAALFIATGQDVANLAESSSALCYTDLLPGGELYFSITIPSLIVATWGGGTQLPTQKECLEILGCNGKGKVNKLAEIVAATILCGELSLASAIVTGEHITSHERYGRNR